MITPKAGFEADAESVVVEVANRVEIFRRSLGAKTDDVVAALSPIRVRIEEDLEALRRAFETAKAATEDSWEYAVDEFEVALERLGSDLRMGHADLAAEMAESLDPYRVAAGEQIDATRAALEQVSLRAHLASMDVGSDIASLNRELRHLRRTLRTEWYRGKEEVQPALDALRMRMRHGLDDVREFVDTIADKLEH